MLYMLLSCLLHGMLPTPKILPAAEDRQSQQRLPGEPQLLALCFTFSLFIHLLQLTLEPNLCLLREVVNLSGGSRRRPSCKAPDNPCAEHFMSSAQLAGR